MVRATDPLGIYLLLLFHVVSLFLHKPPVCYQKILNEARFSPVHQIFISENKYSVSTELK